MLIRVLFYVHLSVCLFFLHDISKTNAARIIKLDTEMFHHQSWKSIYFGVKVASQNKTSASMGLCTLVSAGFL